MHAGDGTTTPDSTGKADDPMVIMTKVKALSSLLKAVNAAEGSYSTATRPPTGPLGDAIDAALSTLNANGKPILYVVVSYHGRLRPQ